jgi:hypothetical protein
MNDKIKVRIRDGSTREGSWNVISPILPCILEFKALTFFLKHNRCSLLDQNNHQDWKGKNVSTFGVLSCWQSKEIWLSKLKEEWFMWEWILIIPFFFLCFPTRNNISCGVELGRILFMWYQQWWHPSKC